MKLSLFFISLLISLCSFSQTGNVGIGTSAPAARLDIAGTNAWNVAAGEGDMRIGDSNYRLKFGVALGGGGAGAANIMQYGQPGGFNVLSLGAQGNQVLYINGSSASVGIGTAMPATTLDVAGTISTSNLVLTGTGNGNTNDFLIKSNTTGLISARKGHGAAALNYIICTSGVFPANGSQGSIDFAWLGEVKLFAGNYAPLGWEFCNGQLLTIADNSSLFAIIGIQYGGNGTTNFALPDLRGAVPVGFGTPGGGGNTWSIGERTQ